MICEKCGNDDLRKVEQLNETTKQVELWIICKPCLEMWTDDTDDPKVADEAKSLPVIEDADNPFGNPSRDEVNREVGQ